MKERIKKILGSILGVCVIAVPTVVLYLVVVAACGWTMTLFGFRYDSLRQALLYFLLAEGISLPFDLFCQALPRVLYRRGSVGRMEANLFYIPLYTLCSMLAFWLADRLMTGVSVTGLSLWVVSFGLALLTQPITKRMGANNE